MISQCKVYVIRILSFYEVEELLCAELLSAWSREMESKRVIRLNSSLALSLTQWQRLYSIFQSIPSFIFAADLCRILRSSPKHFVFSIPYMKAFFRSIELTVMRTLTRTCHCGIFYSQIHKFCRMSYCKHS